MIHDALLLFYTFQIVFLARLTFLWVMHSRVRARRASRTITEPKIILDAPDPYPFETLAALALRRTGLDYSLDKLYGNLRIIEFALLFYLKEMPP